MTTLNENVAERFRNDVEDRLSVGTVGVKAEADEADEALDLDVQLWFLHCVFGPEFNLISAAGGVLVGMICDAGLSGSPRAHQSRRRTSGSVLHG